MISEPGPIICRHRRTITTSSKSIGSSGTVPSVSSTGTRVVLWFDHREVDGQDHDKHNHHDCSGHSKPEYGSPEQRSAMFMLRFDDILFEILFAFMDQKSRRWDQGISWRCSERREFRRRSWALERGIILAWCVAHTLFRSWRSRGEAVLGGGGGHEEEGGRGQGNRRRGPPRTPYMYVTERAWLSVGDINQGCFGTGSVIQECCR